MRDASPQSLTKLAVAAAREAGALALSFADGKAKSWEKADKTPVTEADIAVDDMLKDRLTGAFPDFGWLSEETRDDAAARANADITWVVDPIDGTRAFVKGRPEWVISIAAVQNNTTISGVIFNPVTDEMFQATVGGGAQLNGTPISTSEARQLDGCRMLAYGDMIRHRDWPEPWPDMHLEQRNAVAYRIALVAAGQFDATLSISLKHEWDIAAGALIAQEAGGTVTDHKGGALKFNQPGSGEQNLICAGPKLHSHILKRVQFIPLARIKTAQA